MPTADADMRIQSAQSAQPSETAAADSESPNFSKSSVPQQDSQPVMAQSPAKSTAYQPSRFAAEAVQEADISKGDSRPESSQFDGTRQGLKEEELSGTGGRGPSDTPWIAREAEQAGAPAQQGVVTQQSSDSDSRQGDGFDNRAGRLSDQPHGPGQGFSEQPQDARGTFTSNSAPGLSGVKQVLTPLHFPVPVILAPIECYDSGFLPYIFWLYAKQGTLGRIDSATNVDTSVEIRMDDRICAASVIQPLNRSINTGSAVNSTQSTLPCVRHRLYPAAVLTLLTSIMHSTCSNVMHSTVATVSYRAHFSQYHAQQIRNSILWSAFLTVSCTAHEP